MLRRRGTKTSEIEADRHSHAPSVVAVIGLTLGLSIVLTFGEIVLGVLGPVFEDELGVELNQMGLLMATFFVFNGLVIIPSGFLADRIDPRKTVGVQVLLGLAIFALFAIAHAPIHLFIICGLSGAALALNGPIGNRIIVDFVEVHKRATVIAWKSLGLQVSGVLAGFIFGVTAGWLDWRTTVVICALLMVPFAFWAHFKFIRAKRIGGLPPITVTIPIQTQVPSVDAVNQEVKRSRKKRRAAPIIWWLIPFALLTVGAVTCMATYLVLFGTNDVGLSPSEAGLAWSVASAVSIAARFVWIKWLTARNEVLLLGVSSLLAGFSVLALAISPMIGPIGFWVAACLVGCTLLAANPIQQIVIVRNAHPRYIGRISSIVMVANSLSLAGLPFLIAVCIDSIGLNATWYVVAALTLVGSATMATFAMVRHFKGGYEAFELNPPTPAPEVAAARSAVESKDV